MEVEVEERTERSGSSIWVWNAIGLLGFVLVAVMSVLIINGATKRALEENKRADDAKIVASQANAAAEKARNDAKTSIQQIEAAEKKVAAINKDLAVKTAELAAKQEILDQVNARVKTIVATSAATGSITADQVDNALDSGAPTVQTESDPICYIKFNGGRESGQLAERIHKLFQERKWTSQISRATYQGPSKRGNFVAEVRYSDPADKEFAVTIEDMLKANQMPAFVKQISEPGGQKGILRLWILSSGDELSGRQLR